MKPLAVLFLSLSLPALGAVDKTHGVVPSLLPKYVPSKTNTWKCLDGSNVIPWGFVNDDACDCADGSDEPGTSACPNGSFYCRNEGHTGQTIRSSRVHDGLCEPECCDGSDERPGICENRCQEVGAEYRRKLEAEAKIQQSGAKIRSSFIAFAHQEKSRLEGLVRTLGSKIEAKEVEVERLRDIADRAESISQATLQQKQQSPFYQSLIDHSNALKALRKQHKKVLEREKALGDILNTLRTGYNPNYQDMAVLEAVRGWEQLAGLPHINDVGKEDSIDSQESPDSDKAEVEIEPSEEETEEHLDHLLDTDYVSLLLEHDDHIQASAERFSLFDVTAYLPDSFISQFEVFKDTFTDWLVSLGIIREQSSSSAADTSRARQAYNNAETELQRFQREQRDAEDELATLFDPYKFGAKGEWKKLDGTCVEKSVGDYTYELCFFKEVKQKSTNGGSTQNLGTFDSWNTAGGLTPSSSGFYSKQFYKHGARCWNGPERNIVVQLTCGTENTILSVQELEKCEYEMRATSPALCLPVRRAGEDVKDEL